MALRRDSLSLAGCRTRSSFLAARRRGRRPPGSLLIARRTGADRQHSMPTGWHQIGRTPVRVFDWRREPMAPRRYWRYRSIRTNRRAGLRSDEPRCANDGGSGDSARLRILSAGPGATIQDAGRQGYLRYGVTPAGPMDWTAFQTVALALGNDEKRGGDRGFGRRPQRQRRGWSFVVAFAGGAFDWRRDGRPLPPAARLLLRPGEILSARAGRKRRMDLSWRCGRPRYAAGHGEQGDACAFGNRRAGGPDLARRRQPAGEHLRRLGRSPTQRSTRPGLAAGNGPIRVVLGPQDDYFSAESLARFFERALSR